MMPCATRSAPAWLPASCVPRYPSELYEAFLEGLVLFIVMFALSRSDRLRARFGMLTGFFLIGYAIARITGESFREPDAFLGFLAFGTTHGPVAVASRCCWSACG